MHALLLGASGLVGSQFLTLLLAENSITSVTALVRKPLPVQHTKLRQVAINFDSPDKDKADFKCDLVFSALGTTISKAGSKDNFRLVDYTYQLEVATLAKQQGARCFTLVSALGADAKSPIFYNRVKGEIEEALQKLNFESLLLLRPSILLGARNENRPGEAAAQWVAKKMPFLFSGPLEKYKGVTAERVAAAMLQPVRNPFQGIRVLENLDL